MPAATQAFFCLLAGHRHRPGSIPPDSRGRRFSGRFLPAVVWRPPAPRGVGGDSAHGPSHVSGGCGLQGSGAMAACSGRPRSDQGKRSRSGHRRVARCSRGHAGRTAPDSYGAGHSSAGRCRPVSGSSWSSGSLGSGRGIGFGCTGNRPLFLRHGFKHGAYSPKAWFQGRDTGARPVQRCDVC